MTAQRLVQLSEQQRELEQRHAAQQAEDEPEFLRRRRRMLWQCVALTFVGVPVYAYGWHLSDPGQSSVVASAGFVLSYAAPFFRWVAYLVATSEEFRR